MMTEEQADRIEQKLDRLLERLEYWEKLAARVLFRRKAS